MNTPTPWGLSRLEPFTKVTVVPSYTMELDPETQTGRCVLHDGTLVSFGHRKTYKATETPTQVNTGDGATPASYDPDKDQDSEED